MTDITDPIDVEIEPTLNERVLILEARLESIEHYLSTGNF